MVLMESRGGVTVKL